MIGLTNRQVFDKLAVLCGDLHDLKVCAIMNGWPFDPIDRLQKMISGGEQLLLVIRENIDIDQEPEEL